MFKISKLSKSYGDKILFKDINFSVTPGEKIALIGRNGCGKSTLFKIILDQESPDDGVIEKPKGYEIGYLAQHLSFSKKTIIEEVLHSSRDKKEYLCQMILSGLGFSKDDMSKAPESFSGGFQIRLNLAKLILSSPNMLLLDEPNNYLDIISIRWLVRFLSSWKGESIIISHDRSFLNSISTHTMVIHRQNIKKIKGSTDKLYEQIAQEEEIYIKTRSNQEKRKNELLQFITRFKAKATKARAAKSKEKLIEKMEVMDELYDAQSLNFKFYEADFKSKLLLNIKDISFSYEKSNANLLINSLSFALTKSEKLGVIGKNGYGKSTLLKLIHGQLKPLSGEIKLNYNTKLGYFGQSNVQQLDLNLTIEEEVWKSNPSLTKEQIRSICAIVMFSGNDALKQISVLSGGEKARASLGKIIAKPTNLLLLDEPTNHLDMESIDAIKYALNKYTGSVIVVSHNEDFLSDVVDKLIVFKKHKIDIFDGTYQEFIDKNQWNDEDEILNTDFTKQKNIKNIKKIEKKNIKSLEKKLSTIESKTKTIEKKIEQTEISLAQASAGKPELSDIHRLDSLLKDYKAELSNLESQWEKNFLELEQQKTMN